eukprot:scaffold41445_cov17-Tisochrysis_lutea.AAC.1
MTVNVMLYKVKRAAVLGTNRGFGFRTFAGHLLQSTCEETSALFLFWAVFTGDFAARMLPRALAHLTALIDTEGGDREPEFLEAAFNCLALLCKHLARFLLPDLPAVLRMSAGLRYARAPHVRTFAAQAFGFLLRLAAAAPDAAAIPNSDLSAPTPARSSGKEGGVKSGGVLYSTLRALLAEHALHP